MRRASKFKMSSFTPLLLRNFFIDNQDKSCTPSIINTAASTSAIASGGAVSDLHRRNYTNTIRERRRYSQRR